MYCRTANIKCDSASYVDLKSWTEFLLAEQKKALSFTGSFTAVIHYARDLLKFNS